MVTTLPWLRMFAETLGISRTETKIMIDKLRKTYLRTETRGVTCYHGYLERSTCYHGYLRQLMRRTIVAPILEFQEKETALHPISFISSTFLHARSSEIKHGLTLRCLNENTLNLSS